MKKLILYSFFIFTFSQSFAKNFGAPASTQPGWGGSGILGLFGIAFLIWLFWPSKD